MQDMYLYMLYVGSLSKHYVILEIWEDAAYALGFIHVPVPLGRWFILDSQNWQVMQFYSTYTTKQITKWNTFKYEQMVLSWNDGIADEGKNSSFVVKR